MFGVLGKGRKSHLRVFAFICGRFSAFGGLRRAQNAVLDRKWTQMDANGGLEGPKTGIFSRKTGKGHENRRGRAGNYEIREKREKLVGKCENRQPHAEAWTTYGLST